MSNEEFILEIHDTDGGELLMPCDTREWTPPSPKEGMLQWRHEVLGKEKGLRLKCFVGQF